MPTISVRHLRKNFGTSEVFDALSFDAEDGAITAIFGPNGAGKSTLLSIVAGILTPDAGSAEISGLDNHALSYVFQDYRGSLLPWKSVRWNIGMPLIIAREGSEETDHRIASICADFRFPVDLASYPYKLSGGQQQGVAVLRSLVSLPQFVLMDEPFSALDYENNLLFRMGLQNFYRRTKATILIVTHSLEEAVHLGSRIIVLSKRPSRVQCCVENEMPYPRGMEYLLTPQFAQIRDRVLRAFEETIRISSDEV